MLHAIVGLTKQRLPVFEIIFIDAVDQIALFRKNCIQKTIEENLDTNVILPSLRVHGLITQDEEEQLKDVNRKKQVSRLTVILPSKGPNFLSKLIVCLKETEDEVPQHHKLRNYVLKQALRSKRIASILG